MHDPVLKEKNEDKGNAGSQPNTEDAFLTLVQTGVEYGEGYSY
jgi:hypothetical protein